MDKFLLSTKKRIFVPVIFIGSFVLWLYLCYGHWDSYWNGTIHRVQTTDFNLLHHMMPQTLSQYIIAGRDDLVQGALDSNFGLFGMAVTDPSGQTILYQTNKNYNRGVWQTKLTPEALVAEAKNEPPDLLTDPPPLAPLWEHTSPRDLNAPKKVVRSQAEPPRKVLGYIYYLRPSPPSFFEDMSTWLSTGMTELSGSKRGYFYISLSTLASSLVIVLLIWLRQRVLETKQLELKHIQRELDIRKKALDHLSAELETQKARKLWLEQEAEESQRRAFALKQSLMRLRDSLSVVNAQPAGRAKQLLEGALAPPKSTLPSAVLEEIEQLIPALAGNADALKSQAGLLHDYCTVLEQRQEEMKRIVETAYTRTVAVNSNNIIDMRPL